MEDLLKLPKTIQEQIRPYLKEVIGTTIIDTKIFRNKFEKEKEKLLDKGIKPSIKTMYHLTDTKSAKLIIQNGFNPSRSYYKAFGRGVNLCPKLEDVIKYRRMRKSESKKVSIIVAKVLIGKAHGNSSSDETTVREVNGAVYSKPEYMMPKRGFDSMYSLNPLKQIWIIPSGSRVFPIAEIEFIEF
jgi:hypothetical protein